MLKEFGADLLVDYKVHFVFSFAFLRLTVFAGPRCCQEIEGRHERLNCVRFRLVWLFLVLCITRKWTKLCLLKYH